MICDSHWDSVSTVIAAQKAVTKVMKSYANELSAVLGRFDLYEKGLVRAKICVGLMCSR
jgi:hypothetical protein